MVLTSGQNPRIKHLLALQQKSQQRRSEGLFVVEGRRELAHCLAAGYQLHSLFLCPDMNPAAPLDPPNWGEEAALSSAAEVSPSRGRLEGAASPSWGRLEGAVSPSRGRLEGAVSPSRGVLEEASAPCEVYTLPRQLYERVAYRGSTEGVIAIVRERRLSLSDLQLPPAPLIIVLESVEKPGNLGAVLRSADAARADAVVVCDPLTDLFNPNLIRSSIGAIFTVPTVACSSEACIRFLKKHGISILTAQLQDSNLYYDVDMRGPTAIVMGTESTGLTPQWREAADAHIRIPMLGRLDSLNVSVSAAILLFEAVRQRN